MICRNCGCEVPEGGFLCRNCGNDCRGFLKRMPEAYVKKKSDTRTEKSHAGGFVSSVAENGKHRRKHNQELDFFDTCCDRKTHTKKESLLDVLRPSATKLVMLLLSAVDILLTVIAVVYIFTYSEEVGDVAGNVFLTEVINGFAIGVGMVGLSFSGIFFWLFKKS